MPVDSTALLKGLKPVLKALDADLLKRARDPGVTRGLELAWKREKDARRTGAPLATWKRARKPRSSRVRTKTTDSTQAIDT